MFLLQNLGFNLDLYVQNLGLPRLRSSKTRGYKFCDAVLKGYTMEVRL